MRFCFLDEMQKIVKEGKEKNYISNRGVDGFSGMMKYSERTTRRIEAGKMKAVHVSTAKEIVKNVR